MKQARISAYAFMAMFIWNGAMAAQGDAPTVSSPDTVPYQVTEDQSPSPIGKIADAALECDRLASDPKDKDGPATSNGVEQPSVEAIAPCAAAVAADPQNARINYQAGRAYRRSGELAKAFFYFDRANSLGSLRATVAVADAYLSGSGVPKDESKAIELFKRAASQGDTDAVIQLGQFYSVGPSKNLELAINWLSSVEDGDVYIALGELYFTEVHNDALALKWYRKAADLNKPLAYKKLGWHYYHGRGVPQDYEQAIEWDKLAWDTYPEVAARIGDSYSNLGDTAQMLSWLERGVARGDGYSAFLLAVGYQYQTRGMRKDIDKAIAFYKKAIERGYTLSLLNLGDIYLDGWLGAKNVQLAIKYFQEALSNGHDRAYYNLGLSYLETGDIRTAIDMLEKGATHESIGSMSKLGSVYWNGDGDKRDYQKSLFWYKKAAEEGNEYAMNYVGHFYANGFGVARDFGEAGRWYEKAAAAGHAWGNSNLAGLFSRGQGVNKDIALAVDLQEIAMKQSEEVCNDFKKRWNEWTPEFVRAFQSRLAQAYNYKAPIDGRLGSGSMAAIEKVCVGDD